MGQEEGIGQMKFDRTAPGGSVEAACRLENGKAVLEWSFHLTIDVGGQGQKLSLPLGSDEERSLLRKEKGCIRLVLTDRQDIPVLECVQKLDEEEPLQSILLQPELWRGIGNAYLYGMEAILTDSAGNLRDRVQGALALRCLQCTERNGNAELRLNHESFEPKMVHYILPGTGAEAALQRQMMTDLQWMGKLGANCVCLEAGGGQGLRRLFCHLCDRTGFLVFRRDESRSGYLWGYAQKIRIPLPSQDSVPSFRGTAESFFLPGAGFPTSLFYRYQAKWSARPFVRILPESVRRLPDGNFAADCISNCGRIALYTDGSLHEFKSGDGEFHFQGIPVRTPSIMLTAEGEGCSHTISFHKSFTK